MAGVLSVQINCKWSSWLITIFEVECPFQIMLCHQKTCMQFWIKYVYQIAKKTHTWHHGLKAFFTLSLAFLYIIPLSTKMQRRVGPSDLDIFRFGYNGGPVFQNSANVWKLDPWPLNWPNARIRSMHQGGGEGWRGWSSGGFNTNLLSNFGR